MGPALLFGLLLFRFISLPAFLVASVVVDVEPFLVLFLGLDYPLHGFLHSFLGASVIAVVLSLAMVGLDEKIQKIMSRFGLGQKTSWKSVAAASFLGVYLHVFLDSLLYADMQPLFPLAGNPFYVASAFSLVYAFCIVSFILGLVLYSYKSRAP